MERSEAGLKFRIVRGCRQEDADATHPLARLRAHGEWPHRRRATESTEKFPPPHARS